MLGIYVIPVLVLCCSAHGCYTVEGDFACCAMRYIAAATLTTTVVSMGIKLRSIGMVVAHHAPTDVNLPIDNTRQNK